MVKVLVIFLFLIFASSFFAKQVSAQIYTSDKLITVDLGKQKLFVWEGGKVVHETKVSTGMKLTPTVKGNFKIYLKKPMADMKGPSPYRHIYPSGFYHLKNVPNQMYFYKGYAIHAATWHNNFGRVASHGCVNVPPASAQWLFDWVGVGTQVSVF